MGFDIAGENSLSLSIRIVNVAGGTTTPRHVIWGMSVKKIWATD